MANSWGSRASDGHEDPIPGRVTEGIVEALELIDIDHGHRYEFVRSGMALEDAGHRGVEPSTVGDTRWRIVERSLFELSAQPANLIHRLVAASEPLGSLEDEVGRKFVRSANQNPERLHLDR